MTMRWGMPVLTLIGFAGLTGCDHLQQRKFVPPDQRIGTIVSLSPSTTEIVSGSNAVGVLKGRTAADNYPATVKSIPIVASIKPDYEAIKQIAPQAILLDSSLYNASDMTKIKALGATVFVIDATTIKDFETQMYKLGDLLSVQTNESDYVDRIEVARSGAVASKPPKPINVAIILPGHGGAPMISGTKTFLADVVTELGGTVVGPAVDKFVPLNPESITAASPDMILLPTDVDHANADVNSILNDPTLKATKAVLNKKIAAIDQDVALRRGNRVDKLIDNVHKSFSIVGGQN